MSSTINLENFEPGPDLPQKRFLIDVVQGLWRDPAIVAVWLGGSLARGEGDRNSDVDTPLKRRELSPPRGTWIWMTRSDPCASLEPRR